MSNHDLLRLWEIGLPLSTVHRACTFLGAVTPGVPYEELVRRTIGARDAQLLTLREQIFGSIINCHTICPACDSRLEMSFSVSDVKRDCPTNVGGQFALSWAGYELSFRLPNSCDLDVQSSDEPESIDERRVFDRCVVGAQRDGCKIEVAELPKEVVLAVSQRMTEVDPQGDVHLDITCHECTHRWQSPFDIASFLWDEIHAWSVRLLRDIHTLAEAYGWNESEILDLSPLRRQIYLEMVGK